MACRHASMILASLFIGAISLQRDSKTVESKDLSSSVLEEIRSLKLQISKLEQLVVNLVNPPLTMGAQVPERDHSLPNVLAESSMNVSQGSPKYIPGWGYVDTQPTKCAASPTLWGISPSQGCSVGSFSQGCTTHWNDYVHPSCLLHYATYDDLSKLVEKHFELEDDVQTLTALKGDVQTLEDGLESSRDTLAEAADKLTALSDKVDVIERPLLEFKGPRGDQGPTGDKGPTGNKGYTGSQGPVGDKGEKGDVGETMLFPTMHGCAVAAGWATTAEVLEKIEDMNLGKVKAKTARTDFKAFMINKLKKDYPKGAAGYQYGYSNYWSPAELAAACYEYVQLKLTSN